MNTWRRRKGDWVAAGAALLTLIAAMLLAARGVSEVEADVFHAINNAPAWLYRITWLIQFLGLLLIPIAVAVVALVFRKWRLATALTLVVPLKLLVEKAVVKQLVDRQRPGSSTCGGDSECLHVRGDVHLIGPSFPSGHVIIACAIAWLVAPYVGVRWRWALGGVCFAVALSRVYLGAHNPLDVVAGAACGVVIGALLNLVVGVPGATPTTEQAPFASQR